MSGNFVQRGEPALLDKWTRAEMALNSGIDLVLELPVIYSISSAEFFSLGALSILDKLNIVNNLCFGSECGNIRILQSIAKILTEEPSEYKKLLKDNLSKGFTFPLARSTALSEYSLNYTEEQFSEEILNSSNNILGIEYCKSILNLKSSIKPYTIQRVGGNYNSKDLDDGFSSATAIRELISKNTDYKLLEKHLPSSSFAILEKKLTAGSFTFSEAIYEYLKYKILQNPNSLTNLPDIKEGLDNRILSSIVVSSNYKQFLETVKTKRYTYTRIARCLCQYFIGFELFNTEILRKTSPEYVRVLGFNETGAKVLKELKKSSNIEIITKLRDNENPMLKLDILSTKMYSLINNSITIDSDFKKSPIIL